MEGNKLLHHLGVAAGFVGLLLWFFSAQTLGVIDWVTQQVPESHRGAGLMLGIMLVMTPGFFLWKLYNRWLEKRLQISGRYYEEEYYREQSKPENKE